MRKWLSLIFFFCFFVLISTSTVLSEECERTERDCIEISSCQPPCERIVVRQGARNVRGRCVCRIPSIEDSTVSLGQKCEEDKDCAPPGRFCWGEFNSTPVCHENSRAEEISKRQGGLNIACPYKDDPNGGIKTALGCIPVNSLNDFVGWLLKNLIFIASGIAFLLMALGAIQILTSAGNPEKVKAGGELITSAISGLLLIILSLFLLKLIGVDILHIPGFAKP